MLFLARVLELVLLVVRAIAAFFFGFASVALVASVAESALASVEVSAATFLDLLVVAVV